MFFSPIELQKHHKMLHNLKKSFIRIHFMLCNVNSVFSFDPYIFIFKTEKRRLKFRNTARAVTLNSARAILKPVERVYASGL